jgi:hypothetical protein
MIDYEKIIRENSKDIFSIKENTPEAIREYVMDIYESCKTSKELGDKLLDLLFGSIIIDLGAIMVGSKEDWTNEEISYEIISKYGYEIDKKLSPIIEEINKIEGFKILNPNMAIAIIEMFATDSSNTIPTSVH